MGVAKLKWPSLDMRWKSGWKALYKSRLDWFEHFYPLQREELKHFAATGRNFRQMTGVDTSQYRQWERLLSLTLAFYAMLRAFEVESKAQREQSFDYGAAAGGIFGGASCAHGRPEYAYQVGRTDRYAVGIDGNTLIPLTALGVIIGDLSALPLARLQIAACRRGWYELDDRYPIYIFMLMLMADFLDEAMPAGTAASLGDSPLAPLLAQWRAQNSNTRCGRARSLASRLVCRHCQTNSSSASNSECARMAMTSNSLFNAS